MAAKPSMFNVVPAADLKAERDVFLGLPVETTNKQTFHRVPDGARCSPTGAATSTQCLNGERYR